MNDDVTARSAAGAGRRWLHGGLALAAFGVLLALVWNRWPHVAAGFHGAVTVPTGTWLLAAACLLVSYAIRALRIQIEWQHRHPVSWGECAFVILQHNAAVHLLPMRTGELGFPLLLNRRWGVPPAEAIACLLVLRAQDALVMVLIASMSAATVLGLRAGIGGVSLAVALALLLAMILVGARSLGECLQKRATGPEGLATSTPTARPDGEPFSRPASAAGAPSAWRRWLVTVVSAWRRAEPVTWGLSALNWLVKLAALGLLFRAAAGMTPLSAWMSAIGGEAGAALPVQAPAGFGTYEAGAALLGRWAGATWPWPELLGSALAVHLFVIGMALLAAAVAWIPSLVGLHSIGEAR